MSEIQLKGNLSIGGTDVSAFVSSMIIKRERVSVTVPPTLGNIREVQKAGALKEALEITFFSSTAAASLWADLYDALDTDSAELAFVGNLSDAATGPDNPEFSGTIVVLGVDSGAAVGALREQSQTYPITADGITKSDV
jgi:hypothetical protein